MMHITILPVDILCEIFKYTEYSYTSNLFRTCKVLHNLRNEDKRLIYSIRNTTYVDRDYMQYPETIGWNQEKERCKYCNKIQSSWSNCCDKWLFDPDWIEEYLSNHPHPVDLGLID